MNYNCGIIDDLLPLYVDGDCSEESKAAIEAHLASCQVCRDKLDRMKAETVIPKTAESNGKVTVVKYARKIKRHRIRLTIGAVAISVAVACVLSLVFLTIKDMHNYANPVIYEVESGTYNLTSNDLEVDAEKVGDYIFFTNNKRIEVSVRKDVDYSGEVLLWNVDDRNAPVTIAYGKLTSKEKSCTFTGLSSAHRYMVTCDGNEDLMLTVTDGRKISFFGSMKNVLSDIFLMIIEA